jgi:hypothetical protein
MKFPNLMNDKILEILIVLIDLEHMLANKLLLILQAHPSKRAIKSGLLLLMLDVVQIRNAVIATE